MKKLILVVIASVLVNGSLFATESLSPEKCYATGASYSRTIGKKVSTPKTTKTDKKKTTNVKSE